MILYLDASALVKRYLVEAGSNELAQAVKDAELTGTSIITRAETVAAFAKAVRVEVLDEAEGKAARQLFRAEWMNVVRIQATELIVGRAASLAWEYGLRGYDAVHLASALAWQEGLQEAIVFATFDRHLWNSGSRAGLKCFPTALP